MGELYIFEYDSKKIMRKNIILTVLGAVGVLAAVLFFAYCSLLLTEKTIVKVLTYAAIVIAAVLPLGAGKAARYFGDEQAGGACRVYARGFLFA